jgi:hypothetical protein
MTRRTTFLRLLPLFALSLSANGPVLPIEAAAAEVIFGPYQGCNAAQRGVPSVRCRWHPPGGTGLRHHALEE